MNSGTIILCAAIIGISIMVTVSEFAAHRRKTEIAVACIKQGMQWSNWNSECKK